MSVTLVIGAVLGWLIDRTLHHRALAAGLDPEKVVERPRRRGVLGPRA